MKKERYTRPFVQINQQRLTLEQFGKDFQRLLEEDSEFKDAIITGAHLIDNPKSVKDGAIVFDCYLQSIDSDGTFTVPVFHSDNPQ